VAAAEDDKTITGGEPADERAQWSWALFDWANQPYFTLITTFIFAPYFTSYVVGDPTHGQAIWGYALAIAGVIIAFASPVMGAIADAAGPRKPWIAAFQVVCIVSCALLWLARPGAGPDELTLILALVIMASTSAEFSIVFNNAMLPGLVGESRIGRLSGYAWGLGYVGGLLSLTVVLTAFTMAETPLLGLDKTAHEHDRIVGPLTAVWIALFVLPLFLFTPDVPSSAVGRMAAVRAGIGQLWGTLRKLRHYRNVVQFLVARMLYFDGLSAIFVFGGIYASGIFGWTTTDLGVFGIILTIFAAVGAAAGGWLDDRIGSKRTAMWAVCGLALATLGVVSVSVDGVGTPERRDTIFYFFTYAVPHAPGGMFNTLAEQVFLGFGILIGVCGGPAQAASRTMVSRLAPTDMIGEFYGLYALSGKATAFMAPLAVAAVTDAFDSQRAGISTILIFLIVGLVLLLPVREERAA
jgi:UMF1 family MFS transporter